MPTHSLITTSESQTASLGERVARALRPGDVVLLRGELGAGKTCFVRGLARGLGIEESAVSSPTFVIVNVYTKGPASLVHIDAYRLHGPDDLPVLGWDRLIDGMNVVVIEWPERIAEAIPPGGWDVRLEHAGESERRITITPPTGRAVEIEAPTKCRTCGQAVPAVGPSPFCSDRCRLADLNKWFKGDYKISRPINERDLDET